MELDFNKYHTVVEDDRCGKFIEVYTTPDEESINRLKGSFADEGSLDDDIFVLPLDKALDFVKENYPDRTAVCGHGQKDPELTKYIESRGFNFFN